MITRSTQKVSQYGRLRLTNARFTPSSQGIGPFQLMTNAKGLATAEFVDYTFVFH